VGTLKEDVEQLEYERQQYSEQMEKTDQESSKADNDLSKSSVKANEIVVVSALIEEKVALND